MRLLGRSQSHVYTPVDGTYALIFDEEFNGTSVNTANWVVHNSGTFNNAPAQSANVTVSGGFVNLALAGSASSFTGAFMHTSGSTNNFTVNGANGNWYIEGRVKMPSANSTGFWPAFWMNNAGSTPEIDMAEWRGAFPNGMPRTYFNASGAETYHYGSYGDSSDNVEGANLNLGHLGAAFHIYGVLWTSSAITYYIDGVQVGQAVNGQTESAYTSTAISISNGPYAINLTAGANGYGSNNNLVSGTTTFPGVMMVDYIHVYQVGGIAVTPQSNYNGPGDWVGSGGPYWAP